VTGEGTGRVFYAKLDKDVALGLGLCAGERAVLSIQRWPGRSPLEEAMEGPAFERWWSDTATTEHRRLAVHLRIAVDFEHVQLAPFTDVDERQLEAGLPFDHTGRRRVEDLGVEARQPAGVPSQYSHVVDTVKQHGPTLEHPSTPGVWPAGARARAGDDSVE